MRPRLADAAAERLGTSQDTSAEPMAEAEVLRVLGRIARTGKPGDRLRAAELLGRHIGMFREQGERGQSMADLVLAASRMGNWPR